MGLVRAGFYLSLLRETSFHFNYCYIRFWKQFGSSDVLKDHPALSDNNWSWKRVVQNKKYRNKEILCCPEDIVCHQAHDAPSCVGPERTGLRPAHDLDLADIKRAPERAKPREIEIIDEKTHRGIRRLALVLGVLADAADLKIPRSRSAAGKREIGNPVGQVAKMTDRPEAQGRFVEDRHARRNLREWGSPEIGRDAHGRQRHGAGRLGRLGGRQRRGEREAEKRDSNRRMHGG